VADADPDPFNESDDGVLAGWGWECDDATADAATAEDVDGEEDNRGECVGAMDGVAELGSRGELERDEAGAKSTLRNCWEGGRDALDGREDEATDSADDDDDEAMVVALDGE